jgi:ubiquinone/menaquinone biosynthesis C-methylase UbiE
MQRETQSFQDFLELVRGHIYSEPNTDMHTMVIDNAVPRMHEEHGLDGPLLDIGCGDGYAMQKMQDLGIDDIMGLTLSSDDAAAAQARGFDVVQEDMSFTSFADASFKWLWVRHALEHSPFPLLTLLEFNRIMQPGGMAYIEMPSPKCTRLLEDYDNHYSIMGMRQWTCLMRRAGFTIKDAGELKFDITSKEDPDFTGVEVYEWYVLIKNP